ncbi:MAG: S4 domain-containing protein [Candidatus Micrarchaeia archaeon]
MANKGNSRHLKRLAASNYIRISRKVATYVTKPGPGRHKKERSIAIVTLIKEKLGYARNSDEARKIIKAGIVKVNGKKIREEKYPVGYGDFIELGKDVFRIDVDKKGAINLEKGGAESQVHKVIGKYIAKKGKVMLRIYNGDIIEGSNDAKVGDSVILSNGKISKVLKMEKGAKCKVISGIHSSVVGVVDDISPGSASRESIVKIESGGKTFETVASNVMVIG